MKSEYIYYLHTGNNVPKYVGRTSDPARRLADHIEESMSGKDTLKCHWIRGVVADGGSIEMRILEQVPYGQLGSLEYEWQDDLEWSGYHLLNSKRGDRGVRIDEVQLRADIQEHKRNLKKPKCGIARPADFDQAEYDRLVKFYNDNPEALKMEALRRAEIVQQNKKLKKKSTVDA
jgi:GIY-YIG catalytic domain